MKKVIEIEKLAKTYKDFKLRDISFELQEGTVMGLVGSNGAGKTTIIKALLGLIKYEGNIKIFGEKLSLESKNDIGFLLEDSFISDYISIKEADKIFSKIYNNWDTSYYFYLVEKFNLPSDKKNSDFSKGMKMKFKIIVALASRPKLLILDEPTSGLDPVAREEILEIFLDYMQEDNHSILMSSHITSDLEKIADYITYIDKGEFVFSKEKYDLLDEYGILKCSEDDFKKIDKTYVEKYKKSKYFMEVLIKNKKVFLSKYPDLLVDKAKIDELMFIYARGEDL